MNHEGEQAMATDAACQDTTCVESQAQGGSCGIHGLVADELRFYATLPHGHLIRSLMDEHEEIRRQLAELSGLAKTLAEESGDESEVLKQITRLGESLSETEVHHQREELVLFPALVKQGATGPPTVMNEEHDVIRKLKSAIYSSANQPLDAYSRQHLIQSAEDLVNILGQHINKENQIVYPIAVETIDADAWRALSIEAAALGPSLADSICSGSPPIKDPNLEEDPIRNQENGI